LSSRVTTEPGSGSSHANARAAWRIFAMVRPASSPWPLTSPTLTRTRCSSTANASYQSPPMLCSLSAAMYRPARRYPRTSGKSAGTSVSCSTWIALRACSVRRRTASAIAASDALRWSMSIPMPTIATGVPSASWTTRPRPSSQWTSPFGQTTRCSYRRSSPARNADSMRRRAASTSFGCTSRRNASKVPGKVPGARPYRASIAVSQVTFADATSQAQVPMAPASNANRRRSSSSVGRRRCTGSPDALDGISFAVIVAAAYRRRDR
jgi:hypothetical protein